MCGAAMISTPGSSKYQVGVYTTTVGHETASLLWGKSVLNSHLFKPCSGIKILECLLFVLCHCHIYCDCSFRHLFDPLDDVRIFMKGGDKESQLHSFLVPFIPRVIIINGSLNCFASSSPL